MCGTPKPVRRISTAADEGSLRAFAAKLKPSNTPARLSLVNCLEIITLAPDHKTIARWGARREGNTATPHPTWKHTLRISRNVPGLRNEKGMRKFNGREVFCAGESHRA